MSMARNAAANYVGQFYMAAINIVIVPVYIKYLGIEAYGLVGFFSMIQVWFQMLDLGMSPTLGREVARFRGGAMTGLELRRLLRAMEGIFFGVAVVGAVLLVSASDLVAHGWLQAKDIPVGVVATTVKLMGVTVAMRWVSSIYRSAVSGFEAQVWLNAFNMVIATARAAMIVPFLAFAHVGIIGFFVFQLIVSIVECAVLARKTYRTLPPESVRVGFSLAPLRGVLKFSMIVALSAVVWVLVTQTDRLVLSKTLSLPEFGTFTLGVLVAGTVGLAGGPITQALLPRLARLAAEGDEAGVWEAYSSAAQWVCALSAPIAATLALFARPAVWAWTGNPANAAAAAPVLALYALGNGALAMASFPYYLQFAKGNLRLHLIGIIVFVIILVPAIAWASITYGSVGAGVAWATHCILFSIGWTWFVHRSLAPGLHGAWLVRRVLPSWVVVVAMGAALRLTVPDIHAGRFGTGAILAVIGAVLLLCSLATHPDFRARARALRTRVRKTAA